jgi:hypothetical protein
VILDHDPHPVNPSGSRLDALVLLHYVHGMGRHGDYAAHVAKAMRTLMWTASNERELAAIKGHRVKVEAWQDVLEFLRYVTHHADQFVWQPDLWGERTERPAVLDALS